MARHAEWLQRVPAGLKALEQVKTPLIDRATLEKSLRVHRRVAIRFMHRVGGYQARPDVPDRPRLARAATREDRRRRSVLLRTKRRERLGNQLAEIGPWPSAASSSLRRRKRRTANFPASSHDPDWARQAGDYLQPTRRTCSAPHGTRAGQWCTLV